MGGWIKLHRCLLNNPVVMRDSDYMSVWVWLLLRASRQDYPKMFGNKKIILKPGQLVTGRIEISEKLHINQSKVYRILKWFESEHQLEMEVSNKGSLITIVNWELYQGGDDDSEQQMNSKRTSNEQQMNTIQEDKNNKKSILLDFDKEFEALYKPYPRKRGKAPAKKKFVAWITTGSTYAGQRYKFTIDEIFEAVNYYVETKEEWREWKDFSTLMNQIPDFVEGAKERDK